MTLALLLLVLLPVCSFIPGFFLTRHLKLTPSEKLPVSIGLSLLLLYLAAEAIYLLNIDWRWCWAVTIAIVAMAGISWRDLHLFLNRRHARRQLRAFGLLLLTGIFFLLLIRNYSGATWAADWHEHYMRSRFFLEHMPYDTRFLDIYALPARPPMAHLVSAYFLAHLGSAGSRFELFQILFLFLNMLVFFPAVLLAGLMARGGSRQIGLIAAFFVTSPVFIQNSTWTWNKLLSAFFVLLSLALYIRGWQKESSLRIISAAASMACALLVHYSAGPYALFLFLHFLFAFPWRRHKLAESLGSIGIVVMLMATWFGWSATVYGAKATFGSNTTVTGVRNMAQNQTLLPTIAKNFYYTFVPHFLRTPHHRFAMTYQQPNVYGYVRDYFFQVFQPNLPLSLGIAGWIAAGYLLWRMFRSINLRMTLFWTMLIVVTTLLGIVVAGSSLRPSDDSEGLAHICLQPLTLIGLTFLAARFLTLPTWMRAILAISTVANALLGVILQIRVQMLPITTHAINNALIVPINDGLLNHQAVMNAISAPRRSTVFLGDHCPEFIAWLVLGAAILLLGAMIWFIAIRAANGMKRPAGFAAMAFSAYLFGSAMCVADTTAGYRIEKLDESRIKANNERMERVRANVAQRAESADAHYQLAVLLYESGKVNEALTETCNANILDPYHRDARYMVMLLLRAHGLIAPDRAQLTLYMHEHMANAANQVEYGKLLLQHRFFNTARQIMDDAIRRYPAFAPAHQIRSLVLLNSGNLTEAVAEMESALQLAPGSAIITDQLRQILALRGDDPAAIEKRIRELQGDAPRG